ncbi:hypothetical protein [Marinobacter sp.]|uniref:hypothetical protein n=1 Tax=Marinobacter sp. TaxID=50741 RepID=UPI003A8EFD0D
MARHPNHQAFEINRGDPRPRRTGITRKREEQAELARQIAEYQAQGGIIETQPEPDAPPSPRRPAWLNLSPMSFDG